MQIVRRTITAILILSLMLTPVCYALEEVVPEVVKLDSEALVEGALQADTPSLEATSGTAPVTPPAVEMTSVAKMDSTAAPTPQLPVATVVPQVVPLPASPLLVTGYRIDNGLLSYLQIYNSSSALMPLANWKVTFTIHMEDGDREVPPIVLSGYLPGKKYMVLARENFVQGSDLDYVVANDIPSQGVTKLQLSSPDYAIDTHVPTSFADGIRYDLSLSTAGNYTTSSKYVATNSTQPTGGGWYNFTDTTPLRVVEILANSANCPLLSQAKNCSDYIKLQNQSDEPIDLDGYRLRLGYGNASPSIDTAVPLGGTLLPHEFIAVKTRSDGKPLDITASQGNVWLEDSYGLHTYAETIISYNDLGDSGHKGLSWALDATDTIWKWAVASPDGVNDFAIPGMGLVQASSDVKPCAPNQYRSTETNRCRLIETAPTLKPCTDGQYRSEETNRCRSIAATVASALKPCADDQFRNPATGRCKLIASVDDLPKPCAEGQERNEATNRCRKIPVASMPAATFPVEPVKDGTKAFVGWWALGGILVLGAGYASWEWRHEIRRFVGKAATVVHRK